MLSLVVHREPKSVSAEAYRTLRTNIQFLTKGKNTKKIIVTSTESGEGKSITTGNLALSLSASGRKVLIIDCDLRKPSIHKYFKLDNDVGIADVIVEKLEYEKVINKFSNNLHIITAGQSLINPGELLSIDNIEPILNELGKAYDIILIDTPPVISVTDAQLLAAVSDGVIMVLSAGQTNKKLCQRALQLLNNVNANIIGVVLNKVSGNFGAYYNKGQYAGFGNRGNAGKRSRKKEKVI